MLSAYVLRQRGSFHHGLLNQKGVSRVETFSVIVLSSSGDRSPETVQQARVNCLLCEAVYTHWLQVISTGTIFKHLPYLRLCPWPADSIIYRGACRESPLRQPFHTVPHQIPKTEDEIRLAKNKYQKSRRETATLGQKEAVYQKKNRLYGQSATERRRELRRIETPEQRVKRLQRRYLEPKNRRNRGEELAAKIASKCSCCGTTGHNVRTCTQKGVEKPKESVRRSQCRLAGHNVLSCPRRRLEVEG